MVAGTWTPPGAEPGVERMVSLVPLEVTAEGVDPGTAVQGNNTFSLKDDLKKLGLKWRGAQIGWVAVSTQSDSDVTMS